MTGDDTSRARTSRLTLLFTDIEGSTALWERDSARMSQALAAHDALVRAAVERRRGTVVKMIGDGMHAVFDDPAAALAATLELQLALADPVSTCGIALRVRCGLHLGVVERRDNDCFGRPVNRAARIADAAHGGQVLLSQAVVDGLGGNLPPSASLRALGNVRLKDLATAEPVYQLVHPGLRQEFPALRSLEAIPNNLPQQSTTFVGREQALEELRRLLGNARLLTLTGSGGCGKTRLALQIAADSLESFPDGVWLVELAALADPALVPQSIATTLGVKEEPGKPLVDTLSAHLAERRVLLLLDNCEHLLDACARLADTLVRRCARLTVVSTSREALGLGGEQTYRVPSLSLPEADAAPSVASIARSDAVRLFVDRASLVHPDFQLIARNAASVVSVCRRLDGIPLAIELAAARARMLSIEDIERRLDQRFRLLTGGSRTALPRQQTLRSLIDWSYELLREAEKRLLQRLSVFAGGWTLDAAEHVCSGDGVDTVELFDLLSSLCDKSVAQAEPRDGRYRYRLLESVRQYAKEKLLDAGGADAVRRRHRDYFLTLAHRAVPKLAGAAQAACLRELEEEHENLRVALEWSVSAAEAEDALQFCAALHRLWWARGYLSEGREWCARALAMPGAEQPTPQRAGALNVAAVLAYHQNDYPAAKALGEQCLAVRRQLGDRLGIAASLNNLGLIACDRGDYGRARALYEESLALKRALGDRSGIANSLNNLGNVAYDQEELAVARTYYEESLALAREIGDREGVARLLGNLGNVAIDQNDFATARALHEEGLALKRELGYRQRIASSLAGLGNLAARQRDYATARSRYEEALAIGRELGDKHGIATSLEGLAAVAAARGGPLRAAQVWGGAARLRDDIGFPLSPKDRRHHDARVAAARAAAADDAAFARAWDEGYASTLEGAMQTALLDAADAGSAAA